MSKLLSSKWSPWPIAIIGFFAAAIAGGISFVVFCCMHPTDLVTSDYYEQEVRYQAQIEKISRTKEISVVATVDYDPGQKVITIKVPQHHLPSLTGTIHLYRPSSAVLDQQLNLKPDPEGVQLVKAADLAPGLWKIKVNWSADGKGYLLDQKVKI
jgi:hypothetical protein